MIDSAALEPCGRSVNLVMHNERLSARIDPKKRINNGERFLASIVTSNKPRDGQAGTPFSFCC